jgi:hypothetical protein
MTMELLHPELASPLLDTIPEGRQRSAALAIHLAWLEHSSEMNRGKRIVPETPLDLAILYQAAAYTFEAWPPVPEPLELSVPNRVINLQRAVERLDSIPDVEMRTLTTHFANRVIALSIQASLEQDLDYYIQLFLNCIRNEAVIANIASSAISKHSAELTNPDLW